MHRRKFLQYAAVSGLGLLGGGYLYKYRANAQPAVRGHTDLPATRAGAHTPLFIPGNSGPLGILDVTDAPIAFTARSTTLPLLQSKPSPFLIYDTQYGGRSYQNPILRIKRGGQFKASLQNSLSEPTIIHWHGLHVPGSMDGHPRSTIAAGGRYDYAFTVNNRSGTYWYHTHAHELTAEQAYAGLASFFIVEDDDELALRSALRLELGVNDLPLVIQDKQFDAAGALVYQDNPMQQMMGQLGDSILVNLTPQSQLKIENRLYRFRMLNGSNSRIYKIAFMQRGKTLPYAIIGTDAGLLERPYAAQQVFLAPGERVDILFDASRLRSGDEVALKSLAFDPMAGSMMGGMGGMGGSNLPLGAEFGIMQLVVAKQPAAAPAALPKRLSTVMPINTRGATVRNIKLSMGRMRWLINGRTFDMNSVPLQSRANTVELWDIQNSGAMGMPHPMHLHGFSFQVVGRRNSPGQVRRLAQDASGRLVTDFGWKDTILVWPGETVRLVIDFTHPYKEDQLYVFHCHNLEHEDQGMMVNHRVTAI